MRRCSDSSFENPRSRKTFPVDDVTLIALFFAMVLPQLLQFSQAIASDLQIPRRRFPRLLLECVQDVDSVCACGDVKRPVRPADADPDLSDARPYGRHRLPVVRVESLLHTTQLEASQSPWVSWKSSQVTPRTAMNTSGLSGIGPDPSIQMFVYSIQRLFRNGSG